MPDLSPNNKKELEKLFKRLVRQIRPSDLDGTVNNTGTFSYFAQSQEKLTSAADRAANYAKALMVYMGRKPHILSGERFEDGDKARITPNQLTPNDQVWFRDALTKAALDYRFAKVGVDFKSRIIKEPQAGWVNWATTDCCFAAILRKINLPEVVKGLGVTNQYFAGFNDQRMNRLSKDGKAARATLNQVIGLYGNEPDSVRLEQAFEEELAGYLEIPRRVVPDETLIFLLESRLGWTRVKAKTLGELEGVVGEGKSYILSYLADSAKDFWHIVLGIRANKSWTIVDRQKARDGKEEKIPSDLTTNVDAWELDEDSSLYKEIVRKFRDKFTVAKNQLDTAYGQTK